MKLKIVERSWSDPSPFAASPALTDETDGLEVA